MKRRKVIKKRKVRVRRERDPLPWKYCILTLVCGLILVSGFFMAATLHFSSINLGMKNANLRRQAEELRSQKRRLLLSREISLSPSGLRKAGRKIGLRKLAAANIEIVNGRMPAPKESGAATSNEISDSVKTFTAVAKRTGVRGPDTDRKKTTKTSKDSDRKNKIEKRTKMLDKALDNLVARERKISAKARRR